MKQRKKKLPWCTYIAMAFFMVIGILCGVLMARFADNAFGGNLLLERTPLYIALLLLLFVGMYASIFLQLLLHEAGHLVFGLLTGYKFSSFRIMSFLWAKTDGKIRFRRLRVAGTSGQCLMAPPALVDGKMPVFLYNLGGVFVNLLVSAAAFGLSYAVLDAPIFRAFLLIFAISGAGIGLMNGIPMRLGTVDNDGYNAFALRQDREARRAFWVQLKVNEQTTNGVRLQDMPEEWFAIPSDEAMKNSMLATLGVFACNRMVDAHKFAEADQTMAHLLEIDSGLVGIHRSLLLCDRMYIALIAGKPKDAVDGFLTKEQKKFMAAMKKYPSVIRTEYAYALLGEQDIGKAQRLQASFEKRAKTYPFPGDLQSERELMELASDAMDRK